MKQAKALILLLICNTIFAQIPCEYNTNINDSISIYKSTKDYMIYEKNFGGNFKYIFFTLESTNGTATLNINIIQKSKGFLKANCFDKNSKLFLQLNNGKIITLLHVDQESCGTLIRDDKSFDNRILSGTFMFSKGSIEELKNSPVNFIRIKYLTDTEDYVITKEFQSELNQQVYEPETYFMNNLHCVD